MENAMGRLLLTFCTVVFAAAASFASHPAQAMTISTPAGLSAAIEQSDVKQNVYWRRGYWGYSYYRPYAYTYAYRPYAYRPYAYSYAYRPYVYGGYAYRRWR